LRILVTGGAGFIGSHLVRALLEQSDDNEITILDNLSTGSRENIAPLLDSPRVRLVRGSITSKELVTALVAESDVVYHLAASVGVRHFIDHPVDSLLTNVEGSGHVIRAAGERGVPLFVASSSEVYGKKAKVPFREDDTLEIGPTNITRWGYACGKAMDEFFALAYHREYGMPVRIGRFFNTVGPRQTGRYGMVIPRFVDQALKGEDITVYGDGEQSRCFTFVGDAVRLVLKLMDTPEANGEVVNIGGGEEVTIKRLAERIIELTGSSSRIRYVPYEEAFPTGFEDIRRRVPDTRKLERLIGMRPTSSLDDILHSIIEDRRALLR